MKLEAQKIAIAGAVGWKFIQKPYSNDSGFGCLSISPSGEELFADTPRGFPNYPSDLNAMHEAEKVITSDDFKRGLYSAYLGNTSDERMCATATQRAEAFLKTLNLWTE